MLGYGVKTVLVESLDRFDRDPLVQSALLSDLANEGLALIAANTGEDVTAAMQNDPMAAALPFSPRVIQESSAARGRPCREC
jgi:DNA invertase Pin-like site-specific DNA recombinase